MPFKDFFFLGKVTKTSGYKGYLMFFFDVDDIQNYAGLKMVFIRLEEDLVPFTVEDLKIKNNNSALVKLEDISDEDTARALIGNELYLPVSLLPRLSGNKFYFHEVTGFEVWDKTKGLIGKIKGVYDRTHQPLMIIEFKGKEILIPVSDEIVRKVDRKNKNIEISAPEGLIDIYL